MCAQNPAAAQIWLGLEERCLRGRQNLERGQLETMLANEQGYRRKDHGSGIVGEGRVDEFQKEKMQLLFAEKKNICY